MVVLIDCGITYVFFFVNMANVNRLDRTIFKENGAF